MHKHNFVILCALIAQHYVAVYFIVVVALKAYLTYEAYASKKAAGCLPLGSAVCRRTVFFTA